MTLLLLSPLPTMLSSHLHMSHPLTFSWSQPQEGSDKNSDKGPLPANLPEHILISFIATVKV